MLQHITEPVKICIISFQFSVSVDNRIYCTDFFCVGIHLIQIGDDGFLIGDGHIQCRKLFFLQENIQFFSCQWDQIIGIICQLFVNDFGKAVS